MSLLQFANVTALRGSAGSAGDSAFIEGHDAAGDGGQQLVYWDSSSTLADNNGTIFQVGTTNPGRWLSADFDTVTPEQFGCKGDGTTNDYQSWYQLSKHATLNGAIDIKCRPGATYLLATMLAPSGTETLTWTRYDTTTVTFTRPADSSNPLPTFAGLSSLNVQGNGATLLCGAHNYTGADLTSGFSPAKFAMSPFYIWACGSVSLQNLQQDGNWRQLTRNAAAFASTAVSSSGGSININVNNHGFSNNDPVVYSASSVPIGGLTSGNTYYIHLSSPPDPNNFGLAASSGGSALPYTSSGDGTLVLRVDPGAFTGLKAFGGVNTFGVNSFYGSNCSFFNNFGVGLSFDHIFDEANGSDFDRQVLFGGWTTAVELYDVACDNNRDLGVAAKGVSGRFNMIGGSCSNTGAGFTSNIHNMSAEPPGCGIAFAPSHNTVGLIGECSLIGVALKGNVGGLISAPWNKNIVQFPQTFSSPQVSVSGNTISCTTGGGQSLFPNPQIYEAQFTPSAGGGLPSGLSTGTTYFLFALTSTSCMIASSYANAVAGTAIVPATSGTGIHTLTGPRGLVWTFMPNDISTTTGVLKVNDILTQDFQPNNVVRFSPGIYCTLPPGIIPGVDYYTFKSIASGTACQFNLAASYADAAAGQAILLGGSHSDPGATIVQFTFSSLSGSGFQIGDTVKQSVTNKFATVKTHTVPPAPVVCLVTPTAATGTFDTTHSLVDQTRPGAGVPNGSPLIYYNNNVYMVSNPSLGKSLRLSNCEMDVPESCATPWQVSVWDCQIRGGGITLQNPLAGFSGPFTTAGDQAPHFSGVRIEFKGQCVNASNRTIATDPSLAPYDSTYFNTDWVFDGCQWYYTGDGDLLTNSGGVGFFANSNMSSRLVDNRIYLGPTPLFNVTSGGVSIFKAGTISQISGNTWNSSYAPIMLLDLGVTSNPCSPGDGVKALGQSFALTVTLVNGGSGYTIGDVVSLGTGSPVKVQVTGVSGTGHAIATFVVADSGSYSTIPSNPLTASSGAATFNVLAWTDPVGIVSSIIDSNTVGINVYNKRFAAPSSIQVADGTIYSVTGVSYGTEQIQLDYGQTPIIRDERYEIDAAVLSVVNVPFGESGPARYFTFIQTINPWGTTAPANSFAEIPLTVPSIEVGDVVSINYPSSVPPIDGVKIVSLRVQAAGTLLVGVRNDTSSAKAPPTGNYVFGVIRPLE